MRQLTEDKALEVTNRVSRDMCKKIDALQKYFKNYEGEESKLLGISLTMMFIILQNIKYHILFSFQSVPSNILEEIMVLTDEKVRNTYERAMGNNTNPIQDGNP